MIAIRCSCGKRLEVPAAQAGGKGRCPRCKGRIRVVAPGTPATQAHQSVCLRLIGGPLAPGTQYFLAGPGPINVGKMEDQDLRLLDPRVSRRHGRLLHDDDGWRIEDAGSSNGILVNDERIEDARLLTDGDFVRIGDCEFKFVDAFDVTNTAAASHRPSSFAGRASSPAASASVASAAPEVPEAFAAEAFDDGLLRLADLADGETVELPSERDMVSGRAVEAGADDKADGPVCPSCGKQYPSRVRICVACGIDLKTGRALLTTMDHNLDEVAATAERLVSAVSWIIRFGIYPVASEAFGTAKPYTIRAIAILTTVVSFWFFSVIYLGWFNPDSSVKLMLWAGQFNPSEYVLDFTDEYEYADRPAEPLAENASPEEPELTEEEAAALVANLTPEEIGLARFHPYQLLTHVLLHGGLIHLAGNLLFLIVLGSRVNGLIGNIATGIIYPILGIGAAAFQMAASADEPLHPNLGASGAIMGLAGMYLVLFPIHKTHMVVWLRLGLLWGFRLHQKLFAWPGWLVVLFYIAFDVLATLLDAADGVAHWAHLGGFIVGASIAMVGVLFGLIDARGTDLISAILGRHAHRIIYHRRKPSPQAT